MVTENTEDKEKRLMGINADSMSQESWEINNSQFNNEKHNL